MSQNEDFSNDVAGADATNGSAENSTDSKPKTGDAASIAAPEDRKIFIGGLSWETGETQLKEYFGKFGGVESVNLKVNPMTGR